MRPNFELNPHHRRVRAAFEGTFADRVAICEQAFASSVASQVLGHEMITGSTDVHYYEGCAWLDGEQAHAEFVERLYQDCIALHRHFDFDILYLPWRSQTRPTKRVGEHQFLYGNPDGDDWSIGQFDPVSRTFGEVKSGRPELTFEEVEAFLRAEIAKPRSARKEVSVDFLLLRAVREHGDEFVVAGASGMGIPMTAGWLEATVLDPGLLAEYLDIAVENQLAYLEAQRKAGIWFINGGGDFAFNSGPVYSPKFFHEVMAPRWKRLFDFCRANGMVYVMRSDGNLWPVADDLFGWANPHAYYEVDYDAGMRFPELRKRFPNLTLMGNVSCALLRTGTPDQIRQRAIECLESAAPRVILGSSNSILHGTPTENLLALYDTAKNYRLQLTSGPQ
jgi:uroporphyrinogen decarboxylase